MPILSTSFKPRTILERVDYDSDISELENAMYEGYPLSWEEIVLSGKNILEVQRLVRTSAQPGSLGERSLAIRTSAGWIEVLYAKR